MSDNETTTTTTKGKYIYAKGTTRTVTDANGVGAAVETATESQLSITLDDKAIAELLELLTDIFNTNNGHGARLTFYTSPRTAQKTGQTFAATSILVAPKRAPQPNPAWGNKPRGFQQRGGRREYPAAAKTATPAAPTAAPAATKRPPLPRPKATEADESPI